MSGNPEGEMCQVTKNQSMNVTKNWTAHKPFAGTCEESSSVEDMSGEKESEGRTFPEDQG